MNKKIKYLIKNTSLFTIGAFGSKIINFFLVPFYTYILTREQYGTIDLIFTIATVLSPLVMFNIGEAVMRFALDKDSKQKEILSIIFISIVFGIIFLLLIVLSMRNFLNLYDYRWYIYWYVVLIAIKNIIMGYLKGREKIKLYVISGILNTTLIASLNIIFLAIFKYGIKGYLISYILSNLITISVIIFVEKIYSEIKYFSLNIHLMKNMIYFSMIIIPNSLLWWIINSSDRIMVTILNNIEENSILAVSYKIPSLLTTINTILMQAWKFSAIKEQNTVDIENFTNNMLRQFLRLIVFISATIMLLIKLITKVLFPPVYYHSWEASLYLLIGFVFLGISTFIGTIYYVKKKMIGNTLSALLGAIVNLVLNYYLIPIKGAAGATLAALIAYIIIMLYRYFDTKKYQKIFLFKKENMLQLFLLFLLFLSNLLSKFFTYYLSIFIYILILILNYQYLKKIKIKAFFKKEK